MNPIARLEELRAARKRFLSLTPADSPDSPDCLDERSSQAGDNRDNRDNRTGESLKSASGPPTTRQSRQSGQSGQSGGGVPENVVLSWQRWGLLPAVEITPFTFFMPGLHRRDVDLLTAHLKRQPPEVWQWVEAQAARYTAAARHWPAPVCEVAAMLDVLLWQWQTVLTRNAGRFDQISEAARKLRDLEDAANDLARVLVRGARPSATAGEKKEATP